ncbi:MAG: sterol desaturase family protein [Methylovulum sp.]|nr:sterol desaturase family protein [Methylovulum sp.]
MLNLSTLFETDFKWPSAISGEWVAFVLLVFFGVLSTLEFIFPRENLPAKPLRQSYKTNISLFVFNSTVMSLLSVSSLFLLAQRHSHQGLLHYLDNPLWQAVLSFVLLDLLLYLWHKACHQFDRLWMFHRVHHNDPYLNISTAFRVHVIELLITNILKALYIVLMGIDQIMVLVNEAAIALFVMFHHTNITFKGEKLLGYMVIVPYLHRAHHSVQRHEHDSNYGAVLSLWDRLFGSLTEFKPAAIGIGGHSPQDFINLIRFGFALPSSAPVQPPLAVNLDAMIAEAAYYRAERRNFHPGYELLDWLEAKKEIIKLVYGDKTVSKKQTGKAQRNYFGLNYLHALRM